MDEQSIVQDNNAPQEQMLTQTQVNDIVKNAKAKAAEQARREAEQQYQSQIESLRQLNADMRQREEQFRQQQMEQHLQEVGKNFAAKVTAARGYYDDFDETMKNFDVDGFPQVIYLLGGMDNGAHILYDLAKNPNKLTTIDNLAMKSPNMARAELAKIGQSIAANQQAMAQADEQTTNAPLDRLQSSRTTGPNGKKSISDLRAQAFLRG